MFPLRAVLIASFLFANSAMAIEVFVDNAIGRDGNDGRIPTYAGNYTGPVRTLLRATQIAKFGDVVILKDNGIPYYDSLSLTGERHSGTLHRPFVIDGNGATLSGLRSLPREGWQQIESRLWKVTMTRKGYYQLLRRGQIVPEFVPDSPSEPLQALPPGHWVSWRGSVYFRQSDFVPPTEEPFAFSADQTGISLHSVRNVLINNVRLQHYRFDGLHAQGICHNIHLENVSSIENGRAGVVSSGGSSIQIFGGDIVRNGRHQILTFDRSTAVQVDDYSK